MRLACGARCWRSIWAMFPHMPGMEAFGRLNYPRMRMSDLDLIDVA